MSQLAFAGVELQYLTWVASAFGRASEVSDFAERDPVDSAWLRAVRALAAGDLREAAEIYDEMGALSAAAFYHHDLGPIQSLEQAFHALGARLGHGADIFFGLGLLASGLSSSSVGTLSGQVVMQGFIRRRIPIFLRRAITLAPALIVLAIGLDPTDALVGSQVVLSFGIPFALVPLVLLTRRKALMGSLASPAWLTGIAGVLSGLIIALNVFLLEQVFIG